MSVEMVREYFKIFLEIELKDKSFGVQNFGNHTYRESSKSSQKMHYVKTFTIDFKNVSAPKETSFNFLFQKFSSTH